MQPLKEIVENSRKEDEEMHLKLSSRSEFTMHENCDSDIKHKQTGCLQQI